MLREKRTGPGRKQYRCQQDGCTWEFSCLSKLRRHLASHSTQKDYQCPQCERRFKTTYNVQYHVRNMHLCKEKPYSCPVKDCDVRCVSSALLHGHCREAHPDERLHCCTSVGCHSTFLHKDDLLVHQRVHKPAGDSSDDVVFTCDFCQKVLPSKSKLRRHRLFHMQEKHFRCPIKDCGHAYFTKQHLSRHLERGDHLKGGILQCPGCSRVFLQQSLLHCHSVVHCPPAGFVCPFKSCAGKLLGSEDDYHSHLISIHKNTQWHSCGIANCHTFFPNKELQSLHHLLGHRYSSTTLKDLSLIMYSKNDKRSGWSFSGSRDDCAIICLIVRLYPIMRSFSVPNFDPYLASITLFSNTSITCEQLDRVIHNLTLSEIEFEAATKSDAKGTGKTNGNISNTNHFQSLPNSLSLQVTMSVTEQTTQPCSGDVPNLSNEAITCTTIQLTESNNTANHRPALLSMPLLTDLQSTSSNTDHMSSDNSQSSELEPASNKEGSNQTLDEPVTTDHSSSATQEPYSMPLLEDDGVTVRSPFCDAIDEVFHMVGLSSTENNGIFDPTSATILPNDILDMSGESDCVRDLMESIDLSFLLPSDLLEPPLSVLDGEDVPHFSSDTQEMPNFADLSNPLADLTFESLTTIPDSILESTLQIMVEKSHGDLCAPSTSGPVTTRCSDSPAANSLTGKRANNNINSSGSEKRRKAVQLAKVKMTSSIPATRYSTLNFNHFGVMCTINAVCIPYQSYTMYVFDKTEDGKFNRPQGICYSSKGLLFVADRDNHRVQVFDEQDKFSFKFGSASEGPGYLHIHISISKRDHVFVTDWTAESCINRCSENGDFISSPKLTVFGKPLAVAITPDECVLSSDDVEHKLVVCKYNPQKTAEGGKKGNKTREFYHIQGIAISSNGTIYVTETGNDRL